MYTRFLSFVLLLAVAVSGQTPDPTVRMKVALGDGKTTFGDVDVVLLTSSAPLTVANFLKYVGRGSYNNTMFHRSVPGFIVQTGGYTLTGNNFIPIAQDAPVKNEYNISNTRGTLAMAKLGNNPNSATSEFFFNLADNSANLNAQNGGFTVFGRVANTTSQAVIDRIASQPVPSGIFQSPWDSLPLFNYRSGNPGPGNIIVIQSITVLEGIPTPAITSGGVVVPTAFGGGTTAAPGGYLEIYGSVLSGTTRTWADADFNGSIAPITLDTVQATVGGQRAFINFISPGQVNVQIPETAPVGDSVPVVVFYNGLPSPPVNISIKDFAGSVLAPASFKVGDTQYVAALHSGNAKFVSGGNIPNVDADPAVPGETLIMYGVGFGAIAPNFPPLGGRKASGLTSLVNPITVKIGDAEAKVAYAGLAPTFIGLYQINIEVPANVQNGDQPLTIIQGGTPIAQKLFVSVKAGQ